MIRHLSVRHKVTAIAVTTTAIVLVLASVAFVALEIGNYRRALAQELTAIAEITASNSTAAIMFGDRAAAGETLTALDARPNIESAALYKPDGQLFARHGAVADADERAFVGQVVANLAAAGQGKTPVRRDATFHLKWGENSACLSGPIWFDGDVVGILYIRSSLDQISATIMTYLAIVGGIILLAIALASVLAAVMQRQVTLPIYDLLHTMQAVSRERDYTLRATKYGRDELGSLVDGFNDMLTETEAHRSEINAARREAESASRMKSDFLAHMSHELRTPLNAILGFSDFMLSEPHGPLGHESYLEYMRDIYGGGQHLLGVINDILDLSKIEAGAAELHEHVFDPEALIIGCSRLLRERIAKAGLELRAEVAPGLPRLYGDDKLLKRGMLNLLSNAIKFTPAGGRITVRADHAAGGAISLTVSDNGVGIATQKIADVLAPFGQAENVMTRSQDGTGLGLPLVKSFVELHGGTLELRSALGEGTEVTMQFPESRTRPRPVAEFVPAVTPLPAVAAPRQAVAS